MYIGRPNPPQVIPAQAGIHMSAANALKRQASDIRFIPTVSAANKSVSRPAFCETKAAPIKKGRTRRPFGKSS
ncbi:hypothetical protein HNQ57_002302 [Zhongshania antarctica]|uniref:Uncharacterized protein n=1 Tax=Zhongshania antarctica TaxID=641702 RepID=A0A840R6A7_9GAMM|nr:hypothetical protein [Zhongshania antarctica]